MEEQEPSGLSKVRALSTGLVVRPLVEMMLLRERVITEFVRFVVSGDDVVDDGAGFEESNVGIRIVNSY
jgi:hypothetical protein